MGRSKFGPPASLLLRVGQRLGFLSMFNEAACWLVGKKQSFFGGHQPAAVEAPAPSSAPQRKNDTRNTLSTLSPVRLSLAFRSFKCLFFWLVYFVRFLLALLVVVVFKVINHICSPLYFCLGKEQASRR